MADTLEHKAAECIEVCESFQYFLDTFCMIEDKGANTAIPFKLWPAQGRILPVFLSAVYLIILKARQLGLTWLCAAYALWLTITTPLYTVVVISAKEEWAIEFLDRVKFILTRLPDWMYPPVDKESTQHLRFKHQDGLFSEIKSLSTTPEGAQSKTPNLLIMDETARNRYAKSIFASSKPGIDKAGGRIIVISNSHKRGVGWSWTRDIFTGAMMGLNGFKYIFMPWWDCPERPEDFIQRQKESGMDEDDISENYPETAEEAISPIGGSYFGKTLSKHAKNITSGVMGGLSIGSNDITSIERKDVAFNPGKANIVEIWRYPYYLVDGWDGWQWENRYAIGSDVSEGLGLSDSVAYVIDRHYDEIVCRMWSNRIDAHRWGDLLYLLSMYYDNALLCVERTGAGQTTVKRLSELNAPQFINKNRAKIGNGLTKDLGWNQTNQHKHDLSEDLRNWYRTTRGGFYCATLLDQSSIWILHENNKIGPEEGKLGDHVIGGGLTIQASESLGASPKKIEPPPTGWLRRHQEGQKSTWVM